MASGDALHGLTSESLADQAYRALREAIMSGALSPEEKITERGLADRLSVSPTPIREALRRLEQDGLVAACGGGFTPYRDDVECPAGLPAIEAEIGADAPILVGDPDGLAEEQAEIQQRWNDAFGR
jgi:DNA-binding transcriptional MocR family regulator